MDPKEVTKLIKMTLADDESSRLISAAVLKRVIKTTGLRVAGDLQEAVHREVGNMLIKAAKRCLSNNRSTIRPEDL
jgi:histone H3/H4